MLTYPAEPCGEVLIVGAGFSHALSPRMPLTDALGESVVSRIEARSPTLPLSFSAGRFESWLSRIADDQPDLSLVENLANRALFAHCSELLADILSESVVAALPEALATPWLTTLVRLLHVRQATVITFNQDTLLEHAVEFAELYSWDPSQWPVVGTQPSVRWQHLFGGQPPLGVGRERALWRATFRLLKLHGSLNWFWQPRDTSGATIASWFLSNEMPYWEAQPDELSARRRELPGRVPLIVPPAAGKGAFYQAPLLNQLWQDARTALRQPTASVSLLGYSIPQTDLVTSGILSEILGQGSNQVEVVDRAPQPVIERLAALHILGDRVRQTTSMEAFVKGYEERAALDLIRALRALPRDPVNPAYVIVGTSLSMGLKVLRVRRGANDIELELSTAEGAHGSTNIGPVGEPKPLELGSLLDQVRDPSVTRLVARTPGGRSHVLIGAATRVQPSGYGRWQFLIPASTIS